MTFETIVWPPGSSREYLCFPEADFSFQVGVRATAILSCGAARKASYGLRKFEVSTRELFLKTEAGE